jgi:hypothetical protein
MDVERDADMKSGCKDTDTSKPEDLREGHR